ncbi:hypothetical protein K469DRAFT_684370 [Zopfia rhizophila CBS 207.26]|uniref:Uncharacterized protein n=1 Tax=Zopfia rhizophila CBS 207.26 TaxID=1314779 RepID=A0A6A6D750_9PEZI|nr:hypothetical protein K469DRAFT_684370 [Zopfia rhizophila CBS 207.26]
MRDDDEEDDEDDEEDKEEDNKEDDEEDDEKDDEEGPCVNAKLRLTFSNVKEKSDYSALPFDDDDNDDDEFEYHPRNNKALHPILTHYNNGPANKIRGIKSAREAMVTLMKLDRTSSEIENYLAAEKLWTTTYTSAGSMEKYTDQFTNTWNEIQRRQISLDFLVQALLVNHLGPCYTGFQQRKREIGIKKLSFKDLVSQLK